MKIRPAGDGDRDQLVSLIVDFRATLSRFQARPASRDLEAARAELAEYQDRSYPVFVAEHDNSRIVGYLVCRVHQDVVWAEYRRRGIGSVLYAEAERLAQKLGGDTVYNWVDPSNDEMIGFLERRGYNVLNLVELRRPRSGEETVQRIRVGKHEFRH